LKYPITANILRTSGDRKIYQETGRLVVLSMNKFPKISKVIFIT